MAAFGSRSNESKRVQHLQAGDWFQYDMRTWQVDKRAIIFYGDGSTGYEWEVSTGGMTSYLSYDHDHEDNEEYITMTQPVNIAAIEGDMVREITENEDPPEEVTYNRTKFYLDEAGPGEYKPDGQDEAEPFLYWEFTDDDDEQILVIEQWDETEFEASFGKYLEPGDISNIHSNQ